MMEERSGPSFNDFKDICRVEASDSILSAERDGRIATLLLGNKGVGAALRSAPVQVDFLRPREYAPLSMAPHLRLIYMQGATMAYFSAIRQGDL